MKKYIYIAVFALVGVSFLGGCDDYLDAENKSAGGALAEDFYATDEGLQTFLVTAYSGLKWIATNTEINEWGTDLYVAVRSKDPGMFHKYTLSAENSTVEELYKNVYAMINNANGVLMYGGENSIYADEAKFLRCYGYYVLTQHFGGVPYVTRYIDNDERNYPRENLTVIYEKIIAELEGIADSPDLPDRSEGANLGRVSKRAVAALLSKVYLAAGWDIHTTLEDETEGRYTVTSTVYFEKALGWADRAIAGQALTQSFHDKWWPFNENNEEEIFSVQYQREGYPGDILSGGHGLQGAYGHLYGNPVESGLKACGSTLCPSTKAIYLWDKGDERWEGTFMSIMYNSTIGNNGLPGWGKEGYMAYYNNTDNSHLNIAFGYFPYYTNKADLEAWIEANPQRFANTDADKMATKQSKFFIIADPMVIITLNTDGKISKRETMEYHAAGRTAQAGVTVRKYDDPNTEQDRSCSNSCYRDIQILHLSDIYCIAAEAALMAGDEDLALSYVNDVRLRANATNLASFADYEANYMTTTAYGENTPLDVILDERARELFGENAGRWIDLRRTKQLVRYNIAYNTYIHSAADMSNNKGEVKWYRPIPQAEIDTNMGISQENQNPGY